MDSHILVEILNFYCDSVVFDSGGLIGYSDTVFKMSLQRTPFKLR